MIIPKIAQIFNKYNGKRWRNLCEIERNCVVRVLKHIAYPVLDWLNWPPSVRHDIHNTFMQITLVHFSHSNDSHFGTSRVISGFYCKWCWIVTGTENAFIRQTHRIYCQPWKRSKRLCEFYRIFTHRTTNLMHLLLQEYCMTEFLRMSGIYWGVTALDVMDHLEKIDQTSIVEFIKKCQCPVSGGISPCEGHDPHILYTLSAVQVWRHSLFDFFKENSIVFYV